MKKTRRRPIRKVLVLLLALFALALFLWTQQNLIQTETIEVYSSRLPAAFDGLRIVQISDLHGKEFGAGSRGLLAAAARLRPDLIVITGDLVDARPGQMDMVPALAAGLSAIAPTYYVTGNHEWGARLVGELTALLRENGVTPLQNEYEVLTREGEAIVLAGLDDLNGRLDQKTPGELTAEIRGELGDPFLLALSHRNTRFETYESCAFDLTLAGHAHGGLVRLPFTDGLIGPTHEFLPRYTAGRYALPGRAQMVVSRGLGVGSPLQFRLFNRPHLPVIVLRAQNS